MTERVLSLSAIVGAMLGGCASGYHADARLLGLVARAEYGRAREVLYTRTPPGSELTDLLGTTKKGLMAMADGLPDAADRDFEVVFDTLRTQGLNDDRTTESIFVSEEGVRIWKGEPFEQAMAYVAIAENDASRGDWGNARASAQNALFHLRDFSEVDAEPTDYTSVESDFALGYLLHGIAALEMVRREEAEESFAKAVAARPELQPVVDELLGGRYDTILVIDAGLGPRREADGSGGTGVRYVARTPSDEARAFVRWEGGAAEAAQACDVNLMSLDTRWQSLESIRQFKQGLGQLMLIGGAVLASTGGTEGDDEAARLAIGAGLMGLGALAQANARADTRHNELLPQRVYVVPVMLAGSREPVRVEVEGHLGWSMTLHGLWVREPGERELRYVRLPVHGVEWADAPEIVYGNDATGALATPTVPWILGGDDARLPTPDVVHDYARAGLNLGDPLGDTEGELRELYRLEGIRLFPVDDQRMATGHIFEGGHSLFTPMPGTTGFTRLFAREHGAYEPVSAEAREAAARLAATSEHAETNTQETTR